MNFEQYSKCIEKIKDYIIAGDVMQVVFAQERSADFDLPPFELYKSLRKLNPSPYMFFLDFGDYQLVGSSPEILVRLEYGDITVRPIAGTKPRGKNEKDFQNACMAIALANYLMATPGLKKVGKVPISGLPTNEIEEQCKISLENLKIAKIKWSDFTEQEQWVLFTGWKSKKILSVISKNLDKLDSTVAKLENRRMTFTFVMKAFLKTF